MQLLPIIIVVSLLAFFIALTLVILAWRAFSAAERRTKQRTGLHGQARARQFTLRDGKVTAVPHELYGLRKDDPNSTISTVRTGGSKTSREKPRRGPFTLVPLETRPKLFGPRDSSPPSDLEAQTSIDPKKFEENMKTLQALNRQLLTQPQNRPMARKKEQRRKWPGNDSNTVHSKRIADSLSKAYNVPSFPSRQTSQISDYPVSPKSKPVPRDLRRMGQTSSLVDPPQRQISKARSESTSRRTTQASGHLDDLPRGKARQDSGKSFSLPPDFPPEAIQTIAALKVPAPVAAAEVRSSKGRIDSLDTFNPMSFFSANTTKSRNSRASSATSRNISHSGTASKRVSTVPSLPPIKLPPAITIVKAPPPTPATTTSSVENTNTADMPKPLKPSPTKISFEAGTKPETRSRPPDINVDIANATHRTSFLLDNNSDKASVSPATPETEIHIGQSARSTRSFATFASSDLSSTWTFGNAQRMPIFPSVTPKAVGMQSEGNHITPLRPKSKFGRGVKPQGMKALPVLPRSPLSQEDMV
ncbi:MAG: hypothetical protein Q9220_003104 [cf. Caloplaca sp. 1 TL-2023]